MMSSPTKPKREEPKMLVISTAHLKQQDAECLEEGPYYRATWSDGAATLWYLPEPAVIADQDFCNSVSWATPMTQEFLELVLKLRAEGYNYVLFDSDGEEYDDLPTYDW